MMHLTFLAAGSVAFALRLCQGFPQSPAAHIHIFRWYQSLYDASQAEGCLQTVAQQR